jgi:hypothetical protein
MSLQSRREYLERIRSRYGRAGREHKSVILDEFCLNCGYHRKHAVRLLTQAPKPKAKAGRPRRYGETTVSLLKEFWLISDQMCSKRLQAAAPDWLGFLAAPLAAKRQLLAMSPATMDRAPGTLACAAGTSTACRYQAGVFTKETDSNPDRSCTDHRARVFGSRYGGALRRISFGRLHLDTDLYRRA